MSDKTIADKMFLKNAKSMAILNGAAHPEVVAQMPAQLIDGGDAAVDVVLLFAVNRNELEQYLPIAMARLAEKGSLWIAYLKGTASKKTDINRDTINAYATARGATGVAMIALDSDWSALRLKRI
jgi:hypothetical protein